MELNEILEKPKSVESLHQLYDSSFLLSLSESEIKSSAKMELDEIVTMMRRKRESLNKDALVWENKDVLTMSEMDDLLASINNPNYVSNRTKRTNVTVFASGGGTDFQSLIDGCHNGMCPHVDISGLISNNPEATAINRAVKNYIPAVQIERKQFSSPKSYNEELLQILKALRTEIIFLAGYIKLVPEQLTEEYPIYNIHPSILPKHGGKGMYGTAVHESVIARGDKTTGVTIHRVNDKYDDGAIVNQYCNIPVLPSDTPETLQKRVLDFEHKIIPVVFEQLAQDYQVSEAAGLVRHR